MEERVLVEEREEEGREVRLELRVEGPWTTPVEEPVVPLALRRLLRLVAMVLVLEAGFMMRPCLDPSALRRNFSSLCLWCGMAAGAWPWHDAMRGRAQLRPQPLVRPRRGSAMWPVEGSMLTI